MMKKMIKAIRLPLLAASLAIAPSLAHAAQAQGSPEQQDLTRVSNYIRAVKSLTASFVQTDRNGRSVTGHLTLKQPGKIRFEYESDASLLIVGDGKALTMIDYEVRQVQRWPIGNSPLGALIDPSRDIAKFSKVVPTGNAKILSVEAHDPKRPEFGTITLVFNRKPSAPAGLELYGWVAKDAQGNRTAVRLSAHRYNVAISNSAFRWKDPRPKGRKGGG